MFIRRALALVLAMLWLWPAGLYAQSEALIEAHQQGQTLYEAGQYEQAIPFWVKALELAELVAGSENPFTVVFLNNLAGLYRVQGRYAEAEPLYKRMLAIIEKAPEGGPEHSSFANGLNSLAELYRAQGRYAEAEPLYKRSLPIYEKVLGPEHPIVAASLENYGALLRETGRSAEANEMEARAKAIRAKHAEENPAN